MTPFFVALALAQLGPVRFCSEGSPADGQGPYSIQMAPGWKPKRPGDPLGKNRQALREPFLLGPHEAEMRILRLVSPSQQLLNIASNDVDKARSGKDFRDLSEKGRYGGLYPFSGKTGNKVWTIARLFAGHELFDISIQADRKFSKGELDDLAMMLQSIQAGP